MVNVPIALKQGRKGRALSQRNLQERQHAFYGLRNAIGIASRATQADEKTYVPCNAVTNVAETGQIHEEPFFEQRWHRVIQVRKLSKSQQIARYGRVCGSQPEEIRHEAKARGDFTVQLSSRILVGEGSPVNRLAWGFHCSGRPVESLLAGRSSA